MNTALLLEVERIPNAIKRIFKGTPPVSNEQNLWREVAARAVLDAMGVTGLSGEPDVHADAVRCARVWFKFAALQMVFVFDLAGLSHEGVSEAILSVQPYNRGEIDKNGKLRKANVRARKGAARKGVKPAVPRAKRKRVVGAQRSRTLTAATRCKGSA